jgi:hypothetical protein
VASKGLLPGAKLLWGVIHQHMMPDGRCYSSDADLAKQAGAGWRQLIRYCRQLERDGLMRTTQRPGKTSIRELLPDVRVVRRPGPGTALEGRGPCPPRQGSLSSKTGVYKEVKLEPKLLPEKGPAILKGSADKTEGALTAKTAREWTEEEYLVRGRACGFPEHVIQRDLERLRERKRNPKAERMVKASEVKV